MLYSGNSSRSKSTLGGPPRSLHGDDMEEREHPEGRTTVNIEKSPAFDVETARGPEALSSSGLAIGETQPNQPQSIACHGDQSIEYVGLDVPKSAETICRAA
jgi:hypothetical protein